MFEKKYAKFPRAFYAKLDVVFRKTNRFYGFIRGPFIHYVSHCVRGVSNFCLLLLLKYAYVWGGEGVQKV